jgi:hypothetical protein
MKTGKSPVKNEGKIKSRLIALTMEAVRTAETSVYLNDTTRRCIEETSLLDSRRSENVKSQ